MKTVLLKASSSYEIKIGSRLLSTLGQEAAATVGGRNAVIVSDSNVFPLYGKNAEESLRNSGFHVFSFVFPAGESSKNGDTYLGILNFLAQNHITRNDLLLALGGGVVGDLTGFAAATYLRGIAYIQLPTTVLAAVDSSVGGKTAIDLPAGKNLAGAFYQPSLVLCDTDTLSTLPVEIFRDGCAEIIKYAVLYDPDLFAHLAEKGLDFDREAVIARCVELKGEVVMQDEFDTGERMKLNLGHTLAHGIEHLSEFAVSHGRAVAIGMALISRAAAAKGFCTEETAREISRLIAMFGLPTETEYSACSLANAALSDKKRFGDVIRLILPQAIGNCTIYPLPVQELHSFVEAGL